MKKLLFILLNILLSLKLYSHPHVFIDIGMEVMDLQNVKISWTFDPIESENKLYFFDDDGDGKLNKQEISNLYLEGFNDIKKSNYFITISSFGKKYPVSEINNFDVIIEDDKRLTLSFDIALPMPPEDNKISITHIDTSYFIAFSEPSKENIKLNGALYSAVFKNREKPFYYDPEAGRGEVLDTSKPKKGWLMAYPTEVFISTEPITQSFGDYKIGIRERLIQMQRSVYIKLSEELNNLKDRKSIGIIGYILFLSFIYGVIHALGPGHRKIVISSYILSREKISYLKAIGISFTSALIHSGTGILSILILNLVTQKIKPVFLENITESIETISYVGVLLLAILLIILKLIPEKKKRQNGDKPVALSLIILSSLLPCPGAITIMLFSLSLNIISFGIIIVLAMSFGIGLTLSLISVITLKGKTIVKSVSDNKFKVIGRVIEWSGLILLLIFSIFMLLAIY